MYIISLLNENKKKKKKAHGYFLEAWNNATADYPSKSLQWSIESGLWHNHRSVIQYTPGHLRVSFRCDRNIFRQHRCDLQITLILLKFWSLQDDLWWADKRHFQFDGCYELQQPIQIFDDFR